MKKYIKPEVIFGVFLEDDVMTASYDKTSFNNDDDNVSNDIFF